uniref:Uncharacterized protein n=1 Tax=Anguilla anguilla TaxID=7936 RepID=A0A0E9WQJ8_ANGAN
MFPISTAGYNSRVSQLPLIAKRKNKIKIIISTLTQMMHPPPPQPFGSQMKQETSFHFII